MISWYIFQNISVSICAKPFWLSIDSEQFVRRGSATPKLLESLGLRHLGMSMSMSMSWPWVQLWMSAIDADEVQCLYLWSPQHYYGSQAGDQAPSQAWKPRSCKLLTLWSFVTICRAGAEWYPKGCASIPANSNLIFMHLPSKLMRDCFSFPVVVNLMNLFIFWVALDDESFLLEYHVVQAWHLLPFAQLNQGERGRPTLSISVNMSMLVMFWVCKTVDMRDAHPFHGPQVWEPAIVHRCHLQGLRGCQKPPGMSLLKWWHIFDGSMDQTVAIS